MTTSVIMVTHNSAAFLPGVLGALLSDPQPPDQVVVVDSASADDTLEVLSRYPVEVIPMGENVGFARGCHVAVGSAEGDELVFMGHDVVPYHGWLPPLVEALGALSVGAAMATIEDSESPGRYNTSGGHLTYFGIAWVSDSGMPIVDDDGPLVDVAFPSGAAMAIRRSTWDRFGGFRSDFFMYHEDSDLGWRLRLAGLRVVRVPGSHVSHHYDFGRSPGKMYYLERNRWVMLRSNYHRRTLAVLAPALLLVELGTVVVSIRDGWWGAKRRAMRDALAADGMICAGRALTERNRVLPDSVMIAAMDRTFESIAYVRRPVGSGLANALLSWWVSLALPVLRWLDRFGRA